MLTNKSDLLQTMLQYYALRNLDPFKNMPESFNVLTSANMSESRELEVISKSTHKIWICKPGQNSNRGRGIRIFKNVEKIK